MLNDQNRYEEALSLAKEILLEYEDELASLRQLLVESDEEIVSVRGVPLSQCVQVYAYMRDPQAETYFKEALAQFDEQSIDYNITFVLFCFIIILTWIIVKAMNDMHRLILAVMMRYGTNSSI